MTRRLRRTVVFVFASAPWMQPDMTRPADPNDPDFVLQWGLKNAAQVVDGQTGIIGADVDAPGAWDIHMGTSSVVVAIVGRGVDPHPEFADRLLEGRAFVGDLFDTLDTCPHDTHLAGIIAAATNDGIGVAGLNGAAMLLPVRAFDGCNGSQAAVAEGIIWAADQGADVILVAIHFDDPNTNLETAVNYATAQDVLVIASAGNAGNPTVTYPAAYGNCLAVSATTNQDTQSRFSNSGAEVDVAAPGRGIWSTWSDDDYRMLGEFRDSAAAAAFVAGVAALVRSYAPQLSASEVRQLIIDSSDDLGDAGWDAVFGAGRVNAARALETAPAPALRFEHLGPLPDTIPPGRVSSITLRIASVGKTILPTSVRLHYQIDGGPGQASPVVPLGSDLYRVDLPPVPCESALDYYVRAQSVFGTIVTDPIDAPGKQFTLRAVVHETLFRDDFESDLGWTVFGDGDSRSGLWTRVVPVGTSAQPAFDRSPDAGRVCFITGQHIGGDDGTNDVDGGPVVLTSPIIALSDPDIEVSFSCWVSSSGETPDALIVRVSRNGGADWVVADTITSTNAWVQRSFRLTDFPELTGDELRVRFSIADSLDDSLTEAGVDEFHVRAIHCTFAKGDANLDGNVNLLDWSELTACMSGPNANFVGQRCDMVDFDQNLRIDQRDIAAFQNAFISP